MINLKYPLLDFKHKSFLFKWLVLFHTFMILTPTVFANDQESLCEKLQTGDLIYQKSRSFQSTAIKEVTGSLWSHMGVIFKYNGLSPKKFEIRVKKGKRVENITAKKGCYVLEAIQPVSATTLKAFIQRSEVINGSKHYQIKRLKVGQINSNKVIKTYNQLKGRNYDHVFLSQFKKGSSKTFQGFDFKKDKDSYCSELAWMVYAAQGISIGKWTTLGKLLNGLVINKKNTPTLMALEKHRLKKRGLSLKSLQTNNIITPKSIFEDKKFICISNCNYL